MPQSHKLFSVEQQFFVQGRGVILCPGVPRHPTAPVGSSVTPEFGVGCRVVIQRPDGTTLATEIAGVEIFRGETGVAMQQHCPILLPIEINKEDVPIGSTVFLGDGAPMPRTITISADDYNDLVDKAKHLDRAYELWGQAYFNEGPDRVLNLTKFHDLLGMESGAADWPDDAFLGDELPD